MLRLFVTLKLQWNICPIESQMNQRLANKQDKYQSMLNEIVSKILFLVLTKSCEVEKVLSCFASVTSYVCKTPIHQRTTKEGEWIKSILSWFGGKSGSNEIKRFFILIEPLFWKEVCVALIYFYLAIAYLIRRYTI